MTNIFLYDRVQNKSLMRDVGLFACVGIGLFLYGLSQHAPGISGVVIFLGPSLAILIWAFRLHLRTPLELNLLDDGLAQIRSRSQASAFSPADIKRLRLVVTPGQTSWFSIKTTARTWHLPCCEAQGEDIIRQLSKLNPTAQVQRWTGGA